MFHSVGVAVWSEALPRIAGVGLFPMECVGSLVRQQIQQHLYYAFLLQSLVLCLRSQRGCFNLFAHWLIRKNEVFIINSHFSTTQIIQTYLLQCCVEWSLQRTKLKKLKC